MELLAKALYSCIGNGDATCISDNVFMFKENDKLTVFGVSPTSCNVSEVTIVAIGPDYKVHSGTVEASGPNPLEAIMAKLENHISDQCPQSDCHSS